MGTFWIYYTKQSFQSRVWSDSVLHIASYGRSRSMAIYIHVAIAFCDIIIIILDSRSLSMCSSLYPVFDIQQLSICQPVWRKAFQ